MFLWSNNSRQTPIYTHMTTFVLRMNCRGFLGSYREPESDSSGSGFLLFKPFC
nr:MAG TPA: hypothetical protein [Caudoviricetes sp.]